MAVNNCSQSFPLSICLWTPIWHAPMCPNHNNKFYVVVICPTNQSMFYKLVHPKDLIKQSDLSTAERMKLKELTQVVPSSPSRGATLQDGSQPRSAHHRLPAGVSCHWGRPPAIGAARRRSPPAASPQPPAAEAAPRQSPPAASPHPAAPGAAGSGPARRITRSRPPLTLPSRVGGGNRGVTGSCGTGVLCDLDRG